MRGRQGSPWLALDLETTGLSPSRHRVREIATVLVERGRIIERELRLSEADLLKDRIRSSRSRLEGFLTSIPERGFFVSHHAAFDLAFLAELARRLAIRTLRLRAYCTLTLARTLLPELPSHDLVSLSRELSMPEAPAHTAMSDARAVARLFRLLARRFEFGEEADLVRIHGPALQVRYRIASVARLQ